LLLVREVMAAPEIYIASFVVLKMVARVVVVAV
jgi:hypothetical protein